MHLCLRYANMEPMNLIDYIKAMPRGTTASLAKGIHASVSEVSLWAHGKRPIPVSRAAAIEQFTNGAVTRQDMFPDTWQRIWPELADQQPAGQGV